MKRDHLVIAFMILVVMAAVVFNGWTNREPAPAHPTTLNQTFDKIGSDLQHAQDAINP